MSIGIQHDKSGKSLSGTGAKEDEGLNKKASGGLGLKLKLDDDKKEDKKSTATTDNKPKADEKAKLRPEKLVGGSGSVKIIEDDSTSEDDGTVTKDGNTTVISDDAGWKASEESKKQTNPDDIINIVPNRAAPSGDVKNMYDLGDDDEDALGAEISKLADYNDGNKSEEGKADETVEEEAKKESCCRSCKEEDGWCFR